MRKLFLSLSLSHSYIMTVTRVFSVTMPQLLARIVDYSRTSSLCFLTRNVYALCRSRFLMTPLGEMVLHLGGRKIPLQADREEMLRYNKSDLT